MNPGGATVIVQLRDGRNVDITGMDPEVAVTHLLALGVRPVDVVNTVHRIPALVLPKGTPPEQP